MTFAMLGSAYGLNAPSHPSGNSLVASDDAGCGGVDASTGTLGDVIVGANGQTVRRMSDLTDQLEQVQDAEGIK